MVNSQVFHWIFMVKINGIFIVLCHEKSMKKSMKTLWKFPYSWPTKCFIIMVYKNHEIPMKIAFFSWAFNGAEKLMNSKANFSWSLISWVFNGLQKLMTHEFPVNMEIFIDHENFPWIFMAFPWYFYGSWKSITILVVWVFHGVVESTRAPWKFHESPMKFQCVQNFICSLYILAYSLNHTLNLLRKKLTFFVKSLIWYYYMGTHIVILLHVDNLFLSPVVHV